MFYKSSSCKGKAATISLKDVLVQGGASRSKQLCLVSQDAQIWLRCMTLEDKPRWVSGCCWGVLLLGVLGC